MKAETDAQPHRALAKETTEQLTTKTWFDKGRADRQKQFQ